MAGMLCSPPAGCSAGQPAKVTPAHRGLVPVAGDGRAPDCALPRKVEIPRRSYSDSTAHGGGPRLPRSDIDEISIPETSPLADHSGEAPCPLQCPVKVVPQGSLHRSGEIDPSVHAPLGSAAIESAVVASVYSNNQSQRQATTIVRDEERTTVMMCGVPFSYTRDKLVDLFGSRGFSSQFDFIHMPINFNTTLGVGYVFVNFTSHEQAKQFMLTFDGFDGWESFSKKACVTRWSDDQGLEANVSRYRNSPIMGDSVPRAYKPALFRDGEQVPFPEPTKQLRALRCKRQKLLSPSSPAWD